jgi:leucyl aminopeptidase (aminopeptidase T)
MRYNQLFREDNEAIRERYELAMERIALIEQEKTVNKRFLPYFQRTAAFLILVRNVVRLTQEERLDKLTLKEHQSLNRALYEDITGENYYYSYANPAYACEKQEDKFGKLLSFLYAELRGLIIYAYESRLYELTIYLELFIEVYNYFEEENEYTYKDVKRAVYDFMSDYCEVLVTARTRELLDTGMSFAADIIMEEDLSDLRYLYRFGEHITENELKTAQFLNKLPEEQVKAMADTFTEGYRLGFVANRLDLSKKKIVNIRYQLGFERMVYHAILNFRKLGLEPSVYRAAHNAVNKLQHLKIGYHSTSPNKQYDYDHRFDTGLFLDKAFKERKLESVKNALETYKKKAAVYAGPAVIEVFGEELFAPEDKKEAVKLDKRQQKLTVEASNEESLLKKEYMKLEETSFTIISYPIPEIGKDFEEIFAETVKVNTLDSEQYRQIQQHIIDALDGGEYVRILGAGRNYTDMKVKLYPLSDGTKETVFENCVADVNIPVGEVFTSPVLKGTTGVLHVPKVYLNDLEYRELELIFEDGLVSGYNCGNFTEEAKNKSYIRENLLYNRDYLPLGEFAIGTNTTAYMMGRKYDIAPRLPILIAEKTGPHFAIGDTCYKMSEEVRTYNPDGKEIVAKDNEISALRKSEPEKAYFNCHTDITLPYDEIREISVIRKDGTVIPIIRDARFVLEGTQELNKAFDAL